MKDERSEICRSLIFQPQDDEQRKNDAFQKKIVQKKATTKQLNKIDVKLTAAKMMREEVCDIDN